MKNKKGFTLVELIVSFALITAISLAFFRTILSLQQEQMKNIAKNNYKAFTIVLNNSIQKDFLNDNIEKVISCGDSCYDISYTKNGIVRLELDKEKKIITYGNIKEKLPKDYKFIGDIEFTSYINSYEGNDSYIALNINVKSNYESNIENIKYVYQYDSDNEIIELDVDGAEASDIIEYLLYKSPEENGLYEPLLPDGTSTGIRYRGENPNNYVYFNCEDTYNDIPYGEENYDYENACEVWRIIGVFEVDNGKGNVEKRVKLVNTASTFQASWDSSRNVSNDDHVNYGLGINQWGESTYIDSNGEEQSYEGADLMRLLNGYYIKKSGETCIYCSQQNQEICSNDCSDSLTPLSNISISMVENILWNLGAIENSNSISLYMAYRSERSKNSGKVCTSGVYCTDTVIRTSSWLGKVGLIYVSDYGYASAHAVCGQNLVGDTNTCKNNNWMHLSNGEFWTITPYIASYIDGGVTAARIHNTSGLDGGIVAADIMTYDMFVLPSVYLKTNVTFIGDGNGTEDSPYILGINE